MKDFEQRLLQNEDLVRRILESAEEMSEPMTAEEFIAWLHQLRDKPAPRR